MGIAKTREYLQKTLKMKINCFLLFLAARSRADENIDSGQSQQVIHGKEDHVVKFQLNEITKNSKRAITEETIEVLQPLQPLRPITSVYTGYTGSETGSDIDQGSTNEDTGSQLSDEQREVLELQRQARNKPNRASKKASKKPKPKKIKSTRAPKVRPSRPIRFKPSKASRMEKTSSTQRSVTLQSDLETVTAEVTFNDYDSSGNNSFYDNYYYDSASAGSGDYNYDYDYSNVTLLDGSPRRKKPKFDFRVQSNECRVLPSNCNPAKFNFEKCTNDNKFIWQHKDKCKYISTQDQAWRWKSVICKCRKNKEDKKLKCSLETAFEYDKEVESKNNKNKTTLGGWRSFRRDNGRLDWRPISLATSCGNIGRAVASCPNLGNKPFYLDREPKSEDGWEYGEVARLKCPNKIEKERVWKVSCGTGEWIHQNGTAVNHINPWDVC